MFAPPSNAPIAALVDGPSRSSEPRARIDSSQASSRLANSVASTRPSRSMISLASSTACSVSSVTAPAGIPAAIYHGSLPRADKERVIAAFREQAPVLLSTESAGEGRNLQFCHAMVNMDLPWNPMQIEQRLGRLHRVGQDHDVLLTNLVARGTIELLGREVIPRFAS